jgi:hypothetical protein
MTKKEPQRKRDLLINGISNVGGTIPQNPEIREDRSALPPFVVQYVSSMRMPQNVRLRFRSQRNPTFWAEVDIFRINIEHCDGVGAIVTGHIPYSPTYVDSRLQLSVSLSQTRLDTENVKLVPCMAAIYDVANAWSVDIVVDLPGLSHDVFCAKASVVVVENERDVQPFEEEEESDE